MSQLRLSNLFFYWVAGKARIRNIANIVYLMLKMTSLQPVMLAFAANYPDSPYRNQWARDNSLGIQYSPDPHRPDMIPERVAGFIDAGIPVRFHTRYFDFEMGHADRDLADAALKMHMHTLASIQGLGESVVTVHTGLRNDLPVREKHIVDNLARLVEFADRLGIVVCLENLRKGHAGNPFKIFEWASSAGAMLTLDLGHALGCPMVECGLATLPDIADLFGPRLVEVHIYGREDDDGHHPIKDIKPFEATLGKLLETDCRWWTIELADPGQAMDTRNIIENFFESRHVLNNDILGFYNRTTDQG